MAIVKEWCVTVPERWKVQRIKTLFNLRDERNYEALEDVNLISLYTNKGVMQHKDIEQTTGNKARNADGYKKVYSGDIIVNILLCWMGAVGCSAYEGVTSPAYDVYRPIVDLNSMYYHYLFRTKHFSGECYKAGKGIMMMRWRTYSPQFMNILVPVPPRSEQDQIVRFLDWKVSEINKLINLERKKLEILKEMLDSRFQEIISCSKQKISLKRLVSLDNEFIDIDEGVLYQKAGMYNRGRGIFLREPVLGSDMGDSNFQLIHENRLMISGQFAWEDAVFVTTKEDEVGVASHRYYLLKSVNDFVSVEYLFGYFLSVKGLSDLQRCSHGAAGRNRPLNINELLKLKIPVSNEQDKVSNFSKIVRAYMEMRPIVLAKEALLNDLKTTIISDVVTGKIDVRNVEIPAYEHVEDVAGDGEEIAEELAEETEA